MTNHRRAVLTGICVLASATSALALDPAKPLLHLVHDRWTKQDGLATNTANALAQTKDGYLWIGTDEGVTRFDGARFVHFDSTATPGLRGGGSWRLMAASDGRLWIGSSKGLVVHDGSAFAPVEGEGAWAGAAIRAVAELEDGRIAVSAAGAGIAIAEGGRLAGYSSADAPECLDIIDSGRGSVLCAAGREGLWEIAPDRASRLEPATVGAIAARTLQRDARGSFLVGTRAEGVHRLAADLSVAEPLPGTAGGLVMEIRGEAGAIYIAQLGFGVSRVVGDAVEVLPAATVLASAGATALFIDREGSLWVGTDGGGLHRFRDAAIASLAEREGLPNPAVTAVLPARDGSLWVGSAAGLFHFTHGAWREIGAADGIPAGLTVTALVEDDRDRVWAALIGGGVFYREGARFRRAALHREGEPPLILALESAGAGRVHAGGEAGVLQLDGERAEVLLPAGADGARPVVGAVLRGAEGTLWAGTFDRGVLRVRGDEIVAIDGDEGLAPGIVTDLAAADDGGIWVAVYGGGLHRVGAEGRVTAIREEHGLPSNSVLSIVDDGQGALWLGTNDGIVRVESASLRAFARGERARIEARLFGRRDGLRTGECRGGGSSNAERGPDGALWIVASEGLARIDPRRLPRNEIAPLVLIEEFRCGDRSIEWRGSGRAVLPAGARNCEIHYTAPALRVPEEVSFRYRLAGEDASWVEAGSRRVAYFPEFGPGEHDFEVEARNEDGVAAAEPAVLRLRQTPRWNQRPWVWIAGGILALGAVFLAQRGRLRAVDKQRRRLEAVVVERTAELAAVNADLERRVEEGISRLRAAERFAAYGQLVAGVAHEVRHPIFALRTAAYVLAQKAGDAKGEMERPLAMLREETDRMTRLMDDLLLFAREPVLARAVVLPGDLLATAKESFEAAYPGALTVVIEAASELPAIDGDRDRLVQVLVNLLGNAQKHARGATRAVLRAERRGGGVAVSVEDDGCGIEAEKIGSIFEPFVSGGGGTGLGLSIAERVVRAHGATIDVSSAPLAGTTFTIVFPEAAAEK